MTPQFTLKCNNMTPKALKLHLQSIKLLFYVRDDVTIRKISGFFSSTILIAVKELIQLPSNLPHHGLLEEKKFQEIFVKFY
jgi:hypothetical protein